MKYTKKKLDYTIKVSYNKTSKQEIFLKSILDRCSKYGLTFRK
jgi:hypothetical protein